MDRLSALFAHFAPSARTFYAGNLCSLAEFSAADGRGHLHLLRGGRLTVIEPAGARLELAEPTVLLYARPTSHRFVPCRQTGADLICANVDLGSAQRNPLGESLPARLTIPLSRIPALGPTLELLVSEAFDGRDGRQLALDRLFEYFLVLVIRHIASETSDAGGVMAALADPRLGRAMTAMHEHPQRRWTLDDLASEAGMSRTRFALRFREVSGMTPIDYLGRWRIACAQKLLGQGRPAGSVAAAVGYESPAALSRAFRKNTGSSIREWLGRGSTTGP